MRTHALQQAPEMARPARQERAPSAVLAQRRSTFGPSASASAPPILDAGRPLDAATRSTMEAGFGRDLSHIRVHDDARAHDSARDLSARAYAAGEHIVFGEGSYRPQTPAGQALIAHELAHSVQQAGVQMKADGPLPAGADAELERQADRAALDITSGGRAPALSRIGGPAVLRTTVIPPVGNPPTAGTAVTPKAGPPQRLPPGMTVIKDEPAGIGTTELIVGVTSFALPLEKGLGPWVKGAYDEAATGHRLVFSPLIESGRVAAYKEGGEDYKSIWLGNFGFSTTQGLSAAFRSAAKTNEEVKTALADKEVSKLIKGMDANLKTSGCDIDHIVEKQMGGTSIPSNLQLLVSDKNQASGRETYQALVGLVEAIRDPNMRGPGVRKLQLELQSATVPQGTTDPSYVVEALLRKGAVKGTEEVKAKNEGKPVMLSAGGVGETVRVRDAGATPIDSMAKRIIPGMRLTSYARGGAKSKTDKVEGELDSRAISKTGVSKGDIALTAELAPEGTTVGAGAGGEAAIENAAAGETRILKLAKTTNTKIAFYYPYLSPGTLTSVGLDSQGNLTGEGVIRPSIPFLPEIKVRYGPDLLEAMVPLPADKLKAPIPGFRFTGGEIGLTLAPSFVPRGSVQFEIGPRGKPVILGDITAKYEGGAFVAIGKLTPGAKIPGIKEAAGAVEYRSDTGWSGKLTASSTSLPRSTINAELGFTSEGGRFRAYGTGGLETRINDTVLNLKVGWHGGAVSYRGGVTVPKPMPLVDRVRLEGEYANDLLTLSGKADIKWKSIASSMDVTYRRKGEEEDGKFSGKAVIDIRTEKALGQLNLTFDEEGRYWGKGELSYQVTKDMRPKLGLELTKDRRVKLSGEIALRDIVLVKAWPSPTGGKIEFFKGLGGKFSVPTPVPGITAYGEIRLSAGLKYGVGPVALKGIVFSGELYPLEDDPQIKAKLTGKLAVPAYAEMYGTFGAAIGVEVLFGAVGAKGGITVTPALRVEGAGFIDFNADYQEGGFSFEATAYAKGRMLARLQVDLFAEVYAAWGLFSHTWTYPVAATSKQLGPELDVTLGKIGYSRTGQITWPDPSQFDVKPKDLDPLELVKDLMREGKSKDREEAKQKLKEIGMGHLIED